MWLKKGYGFHALCALVDHGLDGTGEPLAIQLRPGNASSNTAGDRHQTSLTLPEQIIISYMSTDQLKYDLSGAQSASGCLDFRARLS